LRYLFLLMGMFSMYNGLLYNEFFAIPNDWFGSCYNTTIRNTTANNWGTTEKTDLSTNFVYPPNMPDGEVFTWTSTASCPENPSTSDSCGYTGLDCVYAFGTDPAWYLSSNMLTFVNSIKMRMSVIIGIAHMSMGITVKGFNAIAKGQWIVLIFEVICGLIILLGLFGWMDFLIIYKWVWYPVNSYSTNA
jgi:V-type H+-transporting ATPase subunit a